MWCFRRVVCFVFLTLLLGAGLNCGKENPATPVDKTAPGTVSDLRVFSDAATTVTLKWTAPGDNGTSGRAAGYDLRYSTDPLTDDNWGSATQVDDVPPPQSAGSMESHTVSGVSNLETYYFGLKTRDQSSNWSQLSNTVSTDGPRTYYVCPDGNGDFENVQDAIFHARDTDTVELCDATYTGTNNRNINYHGKAITVKSTSGNPQECVIDCEAAGRGFVFDTEEDTLSVLQGVTVTNATSTRGAAVYVGHKGSGEGANPKFVNCVFSNSTASTEGGGVYFDDLNTGATLIDCTISGNTGHGVVLNDGTDVIITGCTFDGNDAIGLRAPMFSGAVITDTRFSNNVGRGLTIHETGRVSVTDCVFDGNTDGGISGRLATLTVDNTVFSSNTAANGAAIKVDYDGRLTITNCTFTDNTATGQGGAVVCIDFYDLTIQDCTFSGNTAENGGALYCGGYYTSGQIPIEDCTFFDNTATLAGGAVYLGNEVVYVQFRNCTFAENRAQTGSGIYFDDYTDVRMYDSIIAFGYQGSAAFCTGDAQVTMNCCDVFGNEGGDWTGCIASQGGINFNMAVDPLFCGALGSGILTIRSDSQCATANCGPVGSQPVGCSP